VFLNIKNDIESINVLIEELPELMLERMKDILEIKTAIKLKLVLKGKFRSFIQQLVEKSLKK
jgi:hypothetical protein